MVTTVEISMYPFVKNFRDLIKDFIGKLEEYGEIEVQPGPTSTVLMGDYDQVMSCLTEMVRWSLPATWAICLCDQNITGLPTHMS